MSVVNIAKESLPTGFMAGHGTVGTAEASISTVAFEVRKHIVIRAASGNSGTINVGRPGDAANGFTLAAGEQTPPLYVDSTSKVAVIGSAASQSFSWAVN